MEAITRTFTDQPMSAYPMPAPLAWAIVSGKLKTYSSAAYTNHRNHTLIYADGDSQQARLQLIELGIETPEKIPVHAIVGVAYLRSVSAPHIGDLYQWQWRTPQAWQRPWPYMAQPVSKFGIFTVPEIRINADQHKRLEAIIAKVAKNYGLDAKAFRERIKTWIKNAVTAPNQPLEHLNDMTRSQALIVEKNLLIFARQMLNAPNVAERA